MRSSLKKLQRGFSLSKYTSKEKNSPPVTLADPPSKDMDKITENMKIAKGMKEQYDNLLAAAQTISGASCDFARAIQDMTSCMLEMFGKTSDGETVNVFSMLAKVQFEISKFLEIYAAHVSQTIIKPTDTLIKELQSIEEIERECEEKRRLYDQLGFQKIKSKSSKGDIIGDKLTAIKEELTKQEMQFDIRFKSLQHGQELSLVTQAIRHYTAQCHLFDKSLKTLNTVESSVKKFSQKLKIDRTLDDDSLVPNIIDEDELTRPLASSSNTQEILSGTGTKDFLLQKLPQKEAAKYALPNPNSTNTRMHNQPSVRFETNNKIHVIDMKVYDGDGDGNDDGHYDDDDDDDDGVGSPETNIKNHHSTWNPKHVVGSSMDFTYMPDKNASSSSSMLRSYTQSGPLPARYGHSGPLQMKPKVHTRQRSEDVGDMIWPNLPTHQHTRHQLNKSSVPVGFVSPKLSPSASPTTASPLSVPVINELHKLPTPPQNIELSHTPQIKHLSPSLVKKSRSISSSVAFAKSLHRSSSLCESPIIELPP